jgi:hypothetical protein
MISYKVIILSRTWLVHFLPKGQFVKKYGDSTLAATECDDRTVFLRIDKLSAETIAHELMHCYIEEHSAPTMELNPDQVEELCCDIVAKHGEVLLGQAEQILHAYKVLRGRRVR